MEVNCVFWSFLHVNSVENSYRKAIINKIREKNANYKTDLTTGFRFKSQQRQDGDVQPGLLSSTRQVVFCIYLII